MDNSANRAGNNARKREWTCLCVAGCRLLFVVAMRHWRSGDVAVWVVDAGGRLWLLSSIRGSSWRCRGFRTLQFHYCTGILVLCALYDLINLFVVSTRLFVIKHPASNRHGSTGNCRVPPPTPCATTKQSPWSASFPFSKPSRPSAPDGYNSNYRWRPGGLPQACCSFQRDKSHSSQCLDDETREGTSLSPPWPAAQCSVWWWVRAMDQHTIRVFSLRVRDWSLPGAEASGREKGRRKNTAGQWLQRTANSDNGGLVAARSAGAGDASWAPSAVPSPPASSPPMEGATYLAA